MPRPPLHHNAGITLIKRPHRARTARAPPGLGRAGNGNGNGPGMAVLRAWLPWGSGQGEGLTGEDVAVGRVWPWGGSGYGKGLARARVWPG